jgi:hypothetical protein
MRSGSNPLYRSPAQREDDAHAGTIGRLPTATWYVILAAVLIYELAVGNYTQLVIIAISALAVQVIFRFVR